MGRTEFNFPVTGAAAAANLGLNFALVPPYGLVGAGLALVGSYLVMLALMYVVARRLFDVPYQWGRIARIVLIAGAVFAFGELVFPTSGAAGLLLRAALVPAYGALLYASGFLEPAELAQLRSLRQRLPRWAARSAEAPEDLKALRSRADLMEDMHES
jgi:O-antigen/teichoic acid export membrane protein